MISVTQSSPNRDRDRPLRPTLKLVGVYCDNLFCPTSLVIFNHFRVVTPVRRPVQSSVERRPSRVPVRSVYPPLYSLLHPVQHFTSDRFDAILRRKPGPALEPYFPRNHSATRTHSLSCRRLIQLAVCMFRFRLFLCALYCSLGLYLRLTPPSWTMRNASIELPLRWCAARTRSRV